MRTFLGAVFAALIACCGVAHALTPQQALAIATGDNDARIAALNADFRGKAVPTNVLSWPAFDGPAPEEPPGLPGEGPLFLGDIALAYETCAREAEEAGVSLADHAAHLVVHGTLHLLGHDHAEDGAAEAMEAIETKVLATMGIASPYSPEERPSGATSGQE